MNRLTINQASAGRTDPGWKASHLTGPSARPAAATGSDRVHSPFIAGRRPYESTGARTSGHGHRGTGQPGRAAEIGG
jgi:hypothetical protein